MQSYRYRYCKATVRYRSLLVTYHIIIFYSFKIVLLLFYSSQIHGTVQYGVIRNKPLYVYGTGTGTGTSTVQNRTHAFHLSCFLRLCVDIFVLSYVRRRYFNVLLILPGISFFKSMYERTNVRMSFCLFWAIGNITGMEKKNLFMSLYVQNTIIIFLIINVFILRKYRIHILFCYCSDGK